MKFSFAVLLTITTSLLNAQSNSGNREYPSLLWEITGKGLEKPSYLFGTMHVSNKLAFQLSDSFYLGIRNADVVALETNPESWQEDMSKYGAGGDGYFGGLYVAMPDDYLTINTLKFFKYDKKIERSLYSAPSTINNLLYRNYDRGNSDFEEDTYLDMYIYQCGKRWGKKVAGVESYEESMKLVAEAYRDAAKDRNKRTRRYGSDEDYSMERLQEAYRTGNLDLLDSINKYNSVSEAFDEKFLYKRNEIQAESIDSILASRKSLFVGVGAAHLPGERGVIEMLREMGYKLRPIRMTQRDSHHKSTVEKIRVPVVFKTQVSDDSLFQVDIPGKFYKFGDDHSFDQRQYADMANGSYYMVTRVMTNAWMWGHSTDRVYKTIDSLLYENVPGKILVKKEINRDGYRGFEITNRTRRGDIQRYNIYVTPFEIIFFKISGTGEYVSKGDEADKFFRSIKFRKYGADSLASSTSYKPFIPKYGGFTALFPHKPYVGNDGSWIFDASDKVSGNYYRIVRSDIHNYSFTGEDSIDLKLMEESFAASEFISKNIKRKNLSHQGYPALETSYTDANGNVYLTRFIIRGPHYYAVIARGKKEDESMRRFLDSFKFIDFNYGTAVEKTDTSLYFKVSSVYFPEEKEKLDMPMEYSSGPDDIEESEKEILKSGVFRSRLVTNDATGEKIYVAFFSTRRYFHSKDSATLLNAIRIGRSEKEKDKIIKDIREYTLPGGMRVWEQTVSDSGSSRAHWVKTFYHDGVGYRLITQIDTLSTPSAFLRTYFDSFTPADTIEGSNPFVSKSRIFLNDFLNEDSAIHNRAVKYMSDVKFDSVDFSLAKKAITTLNWKEKKYLETKKSLIAKLSDIKSKEASQFLRDLYYACGDTIELQYISLETLLRQKTPEAFGVFRDILINDPPVLGVKSSGYQPYNSYQFGKGFSNGSFIDNIYDSLQLMRTILPDILPLMNLDDYEEPLMKLVAEMVDSNLVKSADYNLYFSKFLIEAKQELKKQRISEKNWQIRKAEQAKEDEDDDASLSQNSGNADLGLYVTLLLPFAETNPQVKPLIYQVLQSNDNKLRYETMFSLLRNGHKVPDSVLVNFAKDDKYRYDLYEGLKEIKKLNLFPKKYLRQTEITRSKLLDKKSYDKPDSLVFIKKILVNVKGKEAYVHIYKYKSKKDDLSWKIATAGLMPTDTTRMEIEEKKKEEPQDYYTAYNEREIDVNDFYSFTNEKLAKEEDQEEQFNKIVRKLVYSKNKSAKEFYSSEERNNYDYIDTIRY